MQYALAAAALAGLAAAVPAAPAQAAAPECKASYDGKFNIQVVNVTSSGKRDLEKRAALEVTLQNGVLTDAEGRTGAIVANRQFQFDKPPQAGTIYDAGWAVCPNNTLVIGNDAVFRQCLSGDFYNLYDENTAPQCSDVYIYVLRAGAGGSQAQQADGQVTGSPVASQQADGQVTATPAASPVSQIGDGQIQVVSQIADGQIQLPTGAPVSQIGDGQIQAPTGTPVSQIGDGQIQAPTGAPVSQIGDGQIQAPTGAPVTQIGDGQIQAPTGSPVNQIGDGQIQAPANGTVARPSTTVTPYTGAASLPVVGGQVLALAAAVMAIALF